MPTPATPETELTPDLIDRVRKLSPQSKDKLVGLLLDELEGPPDDPEEVRKAWKDEIARRIEAVRNGTMKTYTLEETMEYLQRVVDEGRRP